MALKASSGRETAETYDFARPAPKLERRRRRRACDVINALCPSTVRHVNIAYNSKAMKTPSMKSLRRSARTLREQADNDDVARMKGMLPQHIIEAAAHHQA